MLCLSSPPYHDSYLQSSCLEKKMLEVISISKPFLRHCHISQKCRIRLTHASGMNVIAALQDRRPRRVVDFLRLIPVFTRNYFRSPFRRALFGGISLLGGFFVAQTISLSFGAAGVNDVIASVLCVLLVEYITRFYYTRKQPTFSVALLNNFKMGFTYGLFIDAFKLAS